MKHFIFFEKGKKHNFHQQTDAYYNQNSNNKKYGPEYMFRIPDRRQDIKVQGTIHNTSLMGWNSGHQQERYLL